MNAILLAAADFIDSGRWLKVLFLIAGSMLLFIAWRLQRGVNGFDFTDMLRDENGKASPTKAMQLGAFAATTWILVVMADAGTLTEWYFNGYIIAWTGTRLATKAIDAHALGAGKAVPPPSTVTMSVPAGQTATASAGPAEPKP